MKMRILMVLLLGLAVLGACSSTPDEPAFDNPFDPHGTNPGDGHALVVEARGDSIVMSWDNLSGIVGYSVYWSSDSPDFEGMVLVTDSIPIIEGVPRIEFSHQRFLAEKTNWYRIQGRTFAERYPDDPDPIKVDMLESDPVAIDITLMVQPSEGQTVTPTRYIDLFVLTGVADSVEISNDRSFVPTKTKVYSVTPGADTTVVDYELPTVDENFVDLWVHFRTRMVNSLGPPDSFAIQARFDPKLTVGRGLRDGPGGPFMVDSLLIFGFDALEGADSLQLQVKHTWLGAGDSTITQDITPRSTTDSAKVHWNVIPGEPGDGQVVATLLSDFGFTSDAAIDLRVPVAIGEPQIEIVEGSLVTLPEIHVISTASNAGYIWLSEDPDFTNAAKHLWTDEPVVFTLDRAPPSGFLYAAFTNPILGQTVVTSTPVTLVIPPPASHRR